jgi:hypothetical protein
MDPVLSSSGMAASSFRPNWSMSEAVPIQALPVRKTRPLSDPSIEVKYSRINPLLSGKSSTKVCNLLISESGKQTLTRSHCMTRRMLVEIARNRSWSCKFETT